YGPQVGTEPPLGESRHRALAGFDETDILPFGGRIEAVSVESGTMTPLTYVPPFPIYPPETSWMRLGSTSLPALVLNEAAGGRVAYLAADVDRCFARDNLPDHADLLANVVLWAAGDQRVLQVEGAGLLDCHLYEQPGRLIMHVVNLSGAGTWRPPVHELLPVGPFGVSAPLRSGATGQRVRLLVSGQELAGRVSNGAVSFEIPTITDHEVAVIF
ncbi:MAG: Tat pathway signal protein, partial [Chloroflexota bacterium]